MLEAFGFWVSDMSQPRASMQTPGIPDLYCQHRKWPWRFWVECKYGKNGPTPAQRAWHVREKIAGGTVHVVYSAAELHEAIHDEWEARRTGKIR